MTIINQNYPLPTYLQMFIHLFAEILKRNEIPLKLKNEGTNELHQVIHISWIQGHTWSISSVLNTITCPQHNKSLLSE